jgi:hypothetical protein
LPHFNENRVEASSKRRIRKIWICLFQKKKNQKFWQVTKSQEKVIDWSKKKGGWRREGVYNNWF